MGSMPSNDAVPAGKLKYKTTVPAAKAAKRTLRAKTPVTNTEAAGSGDQAGVPRSHQEAAAAVSAQGEEQLVANGSATAKVEDSIVKEAPGVASHSTAAAGTTGKAKGAAALAPSNGTTGKRSTAGMLSTAGMRSRAAAAGQLSTALNAGQSHGTQESASTTDAAADAVLKAPHTAAAKNPVDPAVPVQQTSANPGLPHQSGASAHPAQGPPSSSSPASASGGVPNSLGPTQAALAASSHYDAPAPTGVSLAAAPDASVLPTAGSVRTTAADQETTAPPARCEVQGMAAPVEGAVRTLAEPAQGFQAQQQSSAEMAAAAAAPAEATVASALANGDAAAAIQVN